MRNSNWAQIHKLLDEFINSFIIHKNSILTNDTNILSVETIDSIQDRFIENYNDEKDLKFQEKLASQFEGASYNEKLVFAHAEWLWSYSVNDLQTATKKNYTKTITGLENSKINDEPYKYGFGSAGQFHKTNKYWEIAFNIELIKTLIEKQSEGADLEELKNWVEAICLYLKYYQEKEKYPVDAKFRGRFQNKALTMYNILTYCAFPDRYERIASNGHKAQIHHTFGSLIKDEEGESTNTDECILLIREKLNKWRNDGFDFYENDLKKLWNYSASDIPYDELQAILYKKAIVLYGPPGTSKTHSANTIANALIKESYLKNKGNLDTFFSNSESIVNNRIHRLQLHANYTYEDFVAGMQLVEDQTKPQKGKLFEYCALAKNDSDNLPHVLILDEINRVDLSRVFGEVFSAMENRNEDIATAVGNFKLNIPDNLYIIGTMNEIDFSLEQIDFALRRRFLWFPYGYNSGILQDIVYLKNEKQKAGLSHRDIERLINASNALNIAISNADELGKQFEIGHTFFAEIVDIYSSFKAINNKTNRIKDKLFRANGPASILWDISIQPILEAYLGNIEEGEKKKMIQDLNNTFFKASLE